MLFMIAGVFVVVAADVIQTYHVALVGYLACGLVLTTSSVNNLLYTFSGARQAAAAGFMLLSMVLVGVVSSRRHNASNCCLVYMYKSNL